jgi:protein-S-isoprenylcysteine O-methyltransferase Ste14
VVKYILAVTMVATTLGVLGSVQSILLPNYRLWPPPGRDSWQFWVTWFILTVGQIGTTLVGIFDWGSLDFEHWSRYLSGIVFMFVGMVFLFWGVKTLSLYQSLGLQGELVTTGPYALTRNPQYLGYLIFYPGFILLSGSFDALVTGSLAMLMFLITPLAEEKWLLDQFGEEYEDYLGKVQRFL